VCLRSSVTTVKVKVVMLLYMRCSEASIGLNDTDVGLPSMMAVGVNATAGHCAHLGMAMNELEPHLTAALSL